MKCSKLVLAIFTALLLSALVACSSKVTGEDQGNSKENNQFELPVYPDAKNIRHEVLKKYNIKAVSYEAKISYPATDIVNFYDKEMTRIDFKPFVEEYHKETDRKWNHYEDGTIEGNPYVAGLSISWADSNHTRRATLILRYYWYERHGAPIVLENNDNLKVSFQVMPFVTVASPTNQ
jgi:hypothetical protein